ncbi:MAG: hypothetical protein UX98_C0002G0001 [Parcubacteria group bacterium GW2011_GWA2_47_26]|nr:MAG: hypothetical protein UX98_C0002G0001 [Parcubacteria group bacterium GW2011_GWA2_47_26]
MRHDKAQAITLRKAGKGYNGISKILGIPKSTLSEWFSNRAWSEAMKTKNIEKTKPFWTNNLSKTVAARKKQFETKVTLYRESAKKEFIGLKDHPLFVAGLMLYWGEGDNTFNGTVRLSNINPELIQLFVNFLERSCRLQKDKIRVALVLYPDLDDLTVSSNLTMTPKHISVG